MQPTRRALLRAGAGSAAVVAAAGCLGLGSPTDESAENAGYTSFFTIQDWAEQVAGDRFGFTNPVSVGQMGHGWSPDGNLARDIASTRAFFYLDTPEFSWAQEVAAELDRDYDDVVTYDLLDGLGPHLIGFDSGALPAPDYGHDYPPESLRLDEFDIYDLRSDDQLGYWHTEHWHGGVPDVPVGSMVPVGIVIEDDQGRVVPLGDGERYRVDARVADGEPENVDINAHGRQVEFTGVETGRTAVVFEVIEGDEVIYDTAAEPAPFEVIEEDATGATEFHDPHVWIDPVLGQEMVGGIRDALVELDPDNADHYEENAAAYAERMDTVHREFEAIDEEADREVAVLAGHDSFRYLERRYGFELRTPTGISPDAAESFEDIADLIEVIEERDIHTVLYDPFEAPDPETDVPQMVEVIFENTNVENAEPLTPAEGITATWQEEGWGWVEQMEEINVPSLRKALDA
ncbi:zinc ABC transporter solute-binding protein [Halorubrum sp. JWXQ-INN 858]|uniref:metal ABC transporter substrate-binding protein n=1 Tax=Halorubrum sp. JWXQ-INN 858 TaxID=2690782 RepID=UPI001357E37E|nr:metal ABC transporter substrate-binding protein [Halorubrum sp. JWXQ-INN 858]MWV65045.1 zinc ABC transporter solute-binding protein [Halorubrum sp. JWXQ-INN 858]